MTHDPDGDNPVEGPRSTDARRLSEARKQLEIVSERDDGIGTEARDLAGRVDQLVCALEGFESLEAALEGRRR